MKNKLIIRLLVLSIIGLGMYACESETANDPVDSDFSQIKTNNWQANIGVEYRTQGILAETNGLYYLTSSVSDLESDDIIPEDNNINISFASGVVPMFEPENYIGREVRLTGTLVENTNQSIIKAANVLGNVSLATLQVNEIIDIEILNPTPLIPIPELFDVCQNHPGLCASQTPDEYKFALIYSGGVNQRSAYPRYWNDVTLMYQILRDHGYPPQNIRVVYKGGVEDSPDAAPVHYAATAAGFNAAIEYLKDRMHAQSKFFLMMNNHGGGSFIPSDPNGIAGGVLDTDGDEIRAGRLTDNIDEQYYFYEDHTTRLTDDFLAQKLDELSFYDMIAVVKPCYSGGVIWDFQGENRVILTSGTEDEVTWSHRSNMFGEQTYHFFSAILQEDVLTGTPVMSDIDGDGRVSMYEAQKYIIENDTRPESPQYEDDNDGVGVDLGSPTGLGSYMFLD